MATGALFLIMTVGASAATVNGTATIETPSDTAMSYPAASTTPFTVTLPAEAACSGDTATDGYHVYTYMVSQGTDIASLTFVGHPSAGYGLYNNSGAYQGPFNTAPSTGVVQTLSVNLEWGPAVVAGKIPLATLLANGGVWEVGVACANSNTAGALTDNWNIEITFTASSTDPDGFVWSAVPGPPTSPTTTTTSSSTTSTTEPDSTTTTSTTTTTDPDPTTTTSTTSTTDPDSTTTTTSEPTSTTTTTSTPGSTTTSSTTSTTSSTSTSSTTSTTAAANANASTTTTSTTAAVNGSGSTGSSGTGDTGSSGTGTSTGSTSSTGGSLPFTGLPASMGKIIGAGLLGIGLGLMLLASGYRRLLALRTLRLSRSGER